MNRYGDRDFTEAQILMDTTIISVSLFKNLVCGVREYMSLRKVMKNHRAFPTDESALKLIYLAIQNITKKWTMPFRDWKPALNRFALEFGDRFPS